MPITFTSSNSWKIISRTIISQGPSVFPVFLILTVNPFWISKPVLLPSLLLRRPCYYSWLLSAMQFPLSYFSFLLGFSASCLCLFSLGITNSWKENCMQNVGSLFHGFLPPGCPTLKSWLLFRPVVGYLILVSLRWLMWTSGCLFLFGLYVLHCSSSNDWRGKHSDQCRTHFCAFPIAPGFCSLSSSYFYFPVHFI